MTFAEVQVLIEENRELLRGPKGVKGDRGEPGEAGKSIKGERGPAGKSITGPRGLPGKNGRDGVDGKSITGPAGKAGPPGKDGVGPDERVRVSQDDPKAGFLADKLTAGSGIEIRTAGGKRGERLVIDAKPQGGGGGGQSGIIAYDDGVAVGAGNKVSFDGGDPVTISGGIIRVPVGSGGGGADLAVADEGTPLTAAAASIDFVGAVTATAVGTAVTVTVPGATTGDLDAVLTAGNDGGGLGIVNAGEISGLSDAGFFGGQFEAQDGDAAFLSGGPVNFTAGVSAAGNTGGELSAAGGNDFTNEGGSIGFRAGNGIAPAASGGYVQVFAGEGEAAGTGGTGYFAGGDADGEAGARIVLAGASSGNPGKVGIRTDDDTGDAGDLLTAQGDGTALWAPKFAGIQTYAASNVTTDRAFNANSMTLDEIADVLGSLIADLRAIGVVA